MPGIFEVFARQLTNGLRWYSKGFWNEWIAWESKEGRLDVVIKYHVPSDIMNNVKELYQLIVPIYINEKIVIDMLAIIEDGFSKVSQINYVEHKVDDTSKG